MYFGSKGGTKEVWASCGGIQPADLPGGSCLLGGGSGGLSYLLLFHPLEKNVSCSDFFFLQVTESRHKVINTHLQLGQRCQGLNLTPCFK